MTQTNETTSPPPLTNHVTLRRRLKFADAAAVLAEVQQLRTSGYHALGRWTLPQICRHLAMTMTSSLTPPDHDQPTASEAAAKAAFFGTVLGPGGMPSDMAIGNPALIPADDCTDAEIDGFTDAWRAVAAYPHPLVNVGRCGPVPIDDVRALHRAHAAHHLSFLQPRPARRTVRYGSTDDVVADVTLLRQGYTRAGNWTLPQVCWHLREALARMIASPVAPTSVEQAARRPLLDGLLAGAPLPTGIAAADGMVPPESATFADVDAFVQQLEQPMDPNRSYMHRLFGPLSTNEAMKITLVHCAHHLGYLVPDAS